MFCVQRKVDPVSSPIELGVEFLTDLYGKGLGYSAINTSRCALSAVISPEDNVSFGENPYVKRFMKGVFQTRPSLPRYSQIWDVTLVLHYLCCMPPV